MAKPLDEEQSPFGSDSTDNSTPKKTGTGRRLASAGDWAPVFIGAIMEGAHVRSAAKLAGVDASMPYIRRRRDKAFRQAWNEAAEIGTKLLEQEAQRRAYHGDLKPVFHKGVECGQVREYSDTLLIFLLKARDPGKYRDGDDSSRQPMTLNVNIIPVESRPPAQLPLDVVTMPPNTEVVPNEAAVDSEFDKSHGGDNGPNGFF